MSSGSVGCKMDGRDVRGYYTEGLIVPLIQVIMFGMGRAATMGLAPAVFGPWMNISGSFLAS